MNIFNSCAQCETIHFISKFSVPEEPDEDAKPRTAPIFVHKPESVQVEEGEWARFCVRVTGHPRPRVMWLLNGHTIVNVRITIINISKFNSIQFN